MLIEVFLYPFLLFRQMFLAVPAPLGVSYCPAIDGIQARHLPLECLAFTGQSPFLVSGTGTADRPVPFALAPTFPHTSLEVIVLVQCQAFLDGRIQVPPSVAQAYLRLSIAADNASVCVHSAPELPTTASARAWQIVGRWFGIDGRIDSVVGFTWLCA